jgi:hypothetical protein
LASAFSKAATLSNLLRRALHCRPWEFGIIDPSAPCTAQRHARDRWTAAVELYKQLEAAAALNG